MFNIQKYLRHVVLAVGLGAASLTAGAAVLPTYHIDLADTTTSNVAYIDFQFNSLDAAAPVTASLSHFTGVPLSEEDRQGDVSGTDTFVIGNAGTNNELFLAVGGPFGFDLNFSEGFLGFDSTFGSNSYFSFVLYDGDGNTVGDPTGALGFSLSTTGVVITSTTPVVGLTAVGGAAVPEPADWALMLTGLAFVVGMTRRNGRANARRSTGAQATVGREIAPV